MTRTPTAKTPAATSARATAPTDNQVHLLGRLSRTAQVRDLPSGDMLVMFSLTVARPVGERGAVDTIECVSTRARVRRSIERVQPDSWIEVDGSLRRRFWRGVSGVQSRYAVEVLSLRKVDPPAAAAPSRTRASA